MIEITQGKLENTQEKPKENGIANGSTELSEKPQQNGATGGCASGGCGSGPEQIMHVVKEKQINKDVAGGVVKKEDAEMDWDYMDANHYLNHLHFFRRQPLLLARMIWGIIRTKVFKQDCVRSVELAVTYNCNLRCDKCFALKWLEGKKSKFLTVEEIKNMYAQAYKMGATHVNLTGGEPVGRKDIVEVVKALKPRGTLISLVTNGIMVTEEKIIALRKAGLNTLQVSLDSFTPELHDKYRGHKGCYEAAIRAAQLAKKHGLNVCFTTVATHENIESQELPNMLKLAKKMGILLLINYAGRSGGWHHKDFLVLTKDDKKVLNQYMHDPFARLQQMFNYHLKPGMCLMGKDKFNVSAYGEVYPCTHVFMSFGNVKDEPLPKILKRMRNFEYFNKETYDCPRCDDNEFIDKFMDPIARDPRPMLDIQEDFGYSKEELEKISV
tara:strand:- start:1570 stop:2889 length:1320 start_codon:yes stop_codon:yes gene_type:complete